MNVKKWMCRKETNCNCVSGKEDKWLMGAFIVSSPCATYFSIGRGPCRNSALTILQIPLDPHALFFNFFLPGDNNHWPKYKVTKTYSAWAQWSLEKVLAGLSSQAQSQHRCLQEMPNINPALQCSERRGNRSLAMFLSPVLAPSWKGP
jgi:hypothetical protein